MRGDIQLMEGVPPLGKCLSLPKSGGGGGRIIIIVDTFIIAVHSPFKSHIRHLRVIKSGGCFFGANCSGSARYQTKNST